MAAGTDVMQFPIQTSSLKQESLTRVVHGIKEDKVEKSEMMLKFPDLSFVCVKFVSFVLVTT